MTRSEDTKCTASGPQRASGPYSPGHIVAALIVLSEAELGGQRALLGAAIPGLILLCPCLAG